MLKKLLLSLVVLISLVLVVAYFLPRDFRLSKSVVIYAPHETVYNYIRHLDTQQRYSVWLMRDINIKINYDGTDGSVGAKQSWESILPDVGVGEQEIKALVPNEKMTVEIRFEKPFKAINYADTTLETVGEQTKVTNIFYGTSKFPMNITNLFLDKMIGGDIQKNLENLKKIMEQK